MKDSTEKGQQDASTRNLKSRAPHGFSSPVRQDINRLMKVHISHENHLKTGGRKKPHIRYECFHYPSSKIVNLS